MDTNGDNRIDKNETLKFFEDNFDAYFSAMDNNGNGFISQDEFGSDFAAADDTVSLLDASFTKSERNFSYIFYIKL